MQAVEKNIIQQEEWETDFEWLQIRHFLKDRFQRDTLPDLNAILFLIGIQELGRWKDKFTKEEKQDLMHIATCRLMSYYDYYEFEGRDGDGWPHWKRSKTIPSIDIKEQVHLYKNAIIRYFKEWKAENDV